MELIQVGARSRLLVVSLVLAVVAAACGADATTSPSSAAGSALPTTAISPSIRSAAPTSAPARTPFRPPASGGADCPANNDALLTLLASLDLGLAVGVKSVDTELISYQGRFTPDNGADQVGPFGGFEPGVAPISLSAGVAVKLAMSNRNLTLTAVDIQIWNRADVVAADGTLLPNPGDRIDQQHLEAAAGSATWTSPGAGDYVIGFGPLWSQACVTGSSLGYASVTVH